MKRFLPLLALLVLASSASAEVPDKAKDITKHLKSSDYDAEVGDDVITATHEDHLNMILKEYKDGILLQSYFDTSEWTVTSIDLIQMVNRLNTNATVARFYIDSDDDVMVESWFAGNYDKKRFETFLDAWHGDTSGQYSIIREYISD